MRYISFNTIAKKCPKGTWMDKESGKCIPIDEWKSKYGGKNKEKGEQDKKKKCPKGKWRDPKTGDCVSQEEWRRRNQKKYRDKETDTKNKKDSKKDYPEYIEHREIKRYERASDIDTSEAEWIFNQGSSSAKWDESIEKAKAKAQSIKDNLTEFKRKHNDNESFASREVFGALSVSENYTTENVEGKVGKTIWGRRNYKYRSVSELEGHVAIDIVGGIAKGLEYMPCLADTDIKFGAMDAKNAGGACWTETDGSSAIRFDTYWMNKDTRFPTTAQKVTQDTSEWTSRVFGYYNETCAVHELTHAYINRIVHDGLKKGYDNNQISNDYSNHCSIITHGDVPKTWNDEWKKVDLINIDNASENYVVFGKFTQNVVKDAMYVAEKIYGMDKVTFMNQMTSYGQTKPKEGIPEAVSDYICNGDNATLANKLIYFSLQRYAKFVYDPEQKDLPSIKDATKDLIKRQKRPRKKKKSSVTKYITFKELMEMDL